MDCGDDPSSFEVDSVQGCGGEKQVESGGRNNGHEKLKMKLEQACRRSNDEE